ncbi:MAG: hypothetical protein WDN30_07315 [Pararobbsia sp.]
MRKALLFDAFKALDFFNASILTTADSKATSVPSLNIHFHSMLFIPSQNHHPFGQYSGDPFESTISGLFTVLHIALKKYNVVK